MCDVSRTVVNTAPTIGDSRDSPDVFKAAAFLTAAAEEIITCNFYCTATASRDCEISTSSSFAASQHNRSKDAYHPGSGREYRCRGLISEAETGGGRAWVLQDATHDESSSSSI
eukprot:scaffold177713_cov35-Tisochrysis_lutea.AAC.1